MNMKLNTKKLVMAALMAALTCVATMMITIPSPFKGYLNLGDCLVLVSGWMLSPLYGFLAAGLGSALADLFSGYVVYAPATFIIKGLMAMVAHYGFLLLRKKSNQVISRIVSGITAEMVMIFGYFIFECFMYGIVASAVNIPANGVQGIAGLILGVTVMKAIEKSKIIQRI